MALITKNNIKKAKTSEDNSKEFFFYIPFANINEFEEKFGIKRIELKDMWEGFIITRNVIKEYYKLMVKEFHYIYRYTGKLPRRDIEKIIKNYSLSNDRKSISDCFERINIEEIDIK